MFDIGFSEIVVIGPERLPKAARTLGHLFGRLQRYVNDVKADISREMELDELRKLQSEMRGAAREFEQSVKSASDDMATGVRNVERELNEAAVASHASEPAQPMPTPAASAGKAAPPQQAALPGFDRI